MFAIFRSATNEDKEAKAQEWVATVAKEIEPLLENANPFFGGSSNLTLAEVIYFLDNTQDACDY